jgi:CheY-like chemotaxis protein
MRSSKPILLVEDDSVDAMTVERAIKDLKVTNPLIHRINGNDALEYLKDRGNDKPCVILLDLNMPNMNGTEFLKVVKADDTLKKIPVVVLTASREASDKINSFALSVAGYMSKQGDYKRFVETIKMVNLYWTLSELPDGE